MYGFALSILIPHSSSFFVFFSVTVRAKDTTFSDLAPETFLAAGRDQGTHGLDLAPLVRAMKFKSVAAAVVAAARAASGQLVVTYLGADAGQPAAARLVHATLAGQPMRASLRLRLGVRARHAVPTLAHSSHASSVSGFTGGLCDPALQSPDALASSRFVPRGARPLLLGRGAAVAFALTHCGRRTGRPNGRGARSVGAARWQP
jgi:hypothetical protein